MLCYLLKKNNFYLENFVSPWHSKNVKGLLIYYILNKDIAKVVQW